MQGSSQGNYQLGAAGVDTYTFNDRAREISCTVRAYSDGRVTKQFNNIAETDIDMRGYEAWQNRSVTQTYQFIMSLSRRLLEDCHDYYAESKSILY